MSRARLIWFAKGARLREKSACGGSHAVDAPVGDGRMLRRVWCADGNLFYDAMGPEFTLRRFVSAVDAAALLSWLRVGCARQGRTLEGARRRTASDRPF